MDDLISHHIFFCLWPNRAAKFQLHVRARAVNPQRNMVKWMFQSALDHQLCLGIISVVKELCLSRSTLHATSTQIPSFRILHNGQQRILDISSRPMRYANYPPDFSHSAQYSAIIANGADPAIQAQAQLSLGTFALTPACKHTNMRGHVMDATRADV